MRAALAPAFTLTELLVVLAIMGLVVGLVSAGAPGMFERAALRQARARLESDLNNFALRARQEAVFGALKTTEEGRFYQLTLGQQIVLTRRLPRDVRLHLSAATLAIDPAGRFPAATLTLEGKAHEETLSFDSITGRIRSAGDRTPRSPRRRRHPRIGDRVFSRGLARRANRSFARTRQRAGGDLRRERAGGGRALLAIWRQFWRALKLFLDVEVRAIVTHSQSAFGLGGMCDDHHIGRRRRTTGDPDHGLCAPTPGLLPAMTLMELLVALSVLSLLSGLAFSSIGPWLKETRRTNDDAAFWSSVAPAHLILTELTTGAVDVDDNFQVQAREAHFRAYAPRLALAPVDIDLIIAHEADGDQLILHSPNGDSVLLSRAPPLRLANDSVGADQRRLVLEAQIGAVWLPLAIAPVRSDGPLVCNFDLISRNCR
jgi:prepilin-type N-terminal cleavage/methylation domain-containing protein